MLSRALRPVHAILYIFPANRPKELKYKYTHNSDVTGFVVLRGRIDEVDDERSYAKHEHKNHLLEKRTSDVTLQQKHLP